MAEYSMVASGDSVKDLQELQQFALGDERIRNGMCPNGCPAMLITIDTGLHKCFECKFILYGTMGENLSKENTQ